MNDWDAAEVAELRRLLAKYWPGCGHIKAGNTKIKSQGGTQCHTCAKAASSKWQKANAWDK